MIVRTAALVGAIALMLVVSACSGGNDKPGATATPTAAATRTALPNLLPLPTPKPFVAQAADCPGGFTTPEDAIDACLGIRRAYTVYVGDCDTPVPAPPGEGFDRPCSTWMDGLTGPRAYGILDIGVDGFDWAIVEQGGDGWHATLWSGCGVQGQADIDQQIEARGLDVAEVRIDDCRYAPAPLLRPSVRLGPQDESSVGNGRTQLSVFGAALYPGRGIRLRVLVHNLTATVLPWTADEGADIQLLSDDGSKVGASEVGGTLARSVSEGIGPDQYWDGWLVFPVEDYGKYTLRYPGQPDLLIDLTPSQCLFDCADSMKE